MYPLRLFKAVMTLFCDINNECFGDNCLREFLLNKECSDFNHERYKVYMYLTRPGLVRKSPLMLKQCINSPYVISVSEVAYYPLGFALYIDKPECHNALGFEINSFCNYDYDEKIKMLFKDIPYITLESPFAADYRTKDEIIKCIKS